MKSLYLPKSVMWRIIYTLGALVILVGVLQLSQVFTSVENQNFVDQQQEQQGEQTALEKQGENVKLGEDNEEDNKVEKSVSKSQFFIEYRMQRDRARGQQIDLLRELVDNEKSSQDVRKEAQNQMLNISHLIEREMEIENMIRAEDFKDAIVFLQEKKATVIVQAPKLSPEENEKIKNIVNRITEIKESDIAIIPKE